MANETSKEYSKGKHPNSLANLNYRGGRPKTFGSKKKVRSLSVTDEGWEGIQLAAEQHGCKSVSEFIEKWGRGEIDFSKEQLDLSA